MTNTSNGEAAGADGIRRSRLDSGLRVVTESLPALRSVAVGFWVGTGSRDEADPSSGSSHFLEHLLFKGTDSRSAQEIAGAIESVGGEMNAFTTHEYTAFYVRVPDRQLELALDILADVVTVPSFRPEEVESERQVILEEIRMRDDTPDDLVHEIFAGALFPDHPIGRSVLGTFDSVGSLARDEIAAYHRAHYKTENMVVAVAGNQDHDTVLRLLAARMERVEGDRPARVTAPPAAPAPVSVFHRSTEQAHLVMGTRALDRDDPDRYALSVLNQVLGGGMSSRLFQEVREKRGLAYSVYSYRGAYQDAGALAIYAGTAPGKVDEVLAVIRGELDRLIADGGVSEQELADAKGHLKGSMALALETSSSRMHRLGRSELVHREVPSLDDLVADIEAVTPDDVSRVVRRVLTDQPRTLAVVGPFSPSDF
ncbi:MAG: pitrilysin family protein [Acidimicrobiia bacterium]